MYYVSIQRYWHDSEGRDCVELASSEPSPDMLANRHYSEHRTFWDAARTACEVSQREGMPITRANSLVYGDPDDPTDPTELLAEAELAESLAPACEGCGEKDTELSEWTDYDNDVSFTVCGEVCFERAMDRAYPYRVITGLTGLYMPNNVYLCSDWQDARRVAIEEGKRWREHSYDQPEDERDTVSIYYAGDREELTIYVGNEAIEVVKV